MSLRQEGVIGNRLLMKKMNFLPSVLLAQVSNYSSFMQKDGERHPPLASMRQGCPRPRNLIYSSHLFAALGSEIQIEESQNII